MASERQRPTSLRILVSTRPQSKAKAPPAQQDRADTSEALKPRAGPKIVADTRMMSVISMELTEHQRVLVVLRTAHSGVSGGALWKRR